MEELLTLLQVLSPNNSTDATARGVSILGEYRFLLLPVIAGLVVLLFGYTGSSHKGKPIPGPPKLPLVGNLLQIKSPITFKKWAREYGELYEVQFGPAQRWVFLNSPQVVKDLLEKQSAVTSTRPRFLSARIVSGDRRMVLMPYGSKWRTLRSIIHPLLTPKAASLLQPAQEFESKQLLWDIYKSTKSTDQGKKGKDEREMSFVTHVRRYSASVVLTMVYGIRASTWVRPPIIYNQPQFDQFRFLSKKFMANPLNHVQESNAIAQIFELMDDFGRVANPGTANTLMKSHARMDLELT